MTCPISHPDAGRCRLSGNHPNHAAGFGKDLVEWPNADYTPPPPRTSLRRMAEIARDLREMGRSSPV